MANDKQHLVLYLVPLNVPHFTSRDTTLYGYDIPERTMVIPLLYSVSLDPKYWDNPTKFNPDRFIGENGKLLKLDANIPFSTGKVYINLYQNRIIYVQSITKNVIIQVFVQSAISGFITVYYRYASSFMFLKIYMICAVYVTQYNLI